MAQNVPDLEAYLVSHPEVPNLHVGYLRHVLSTHPNTTSRGESKCSRLASSSLSNRNNRLFILTDLGGRNEVLAFPLTVALCSAPPEPDSDDDASPRAKREKKQKNAMFPTISEEVEVLDVTYAQGPDCDATSFHEPGLSSHGRPRRRRCMVGMGQRRGGTQEDFVDSLTYGFCASDYDDDELQCASCAQMIGEAELNESKFSRDNCHLEFVCYECMRHEHDPQILDKCQKNPSPKWFFLAAVSVCK